MVILRGHHCVVLLHDRLHVVLVHYHGHLALLHGHPAHGGDLILLRDFHHLALLHDHGHQGYFPDHLHFRHDLFQHEQRTVDFLPGCHDHPGQVYAHGHYQSQFAFLGRYFLYQSQVKQVLFWCLNLHGTINFVIYLNRKKITKFYR